MKERGIQSSASQLDISGLIVSFDGELVRTVEQSEGILVEDQTVEEENQKKTKKSKRAEKMDWELELETSWLYKSLKTWARLWLAGIVTTVAVNVVHIPISYEVGFILLVLDFSAIPVGIFIAGASDDAGRY